MQKKQSKECAKCHHKTERILDFKDCAFTTDKLYFLNWRDACPKCGHDDFLSIGEQYMTNDPNEMIIPESIVFRWLENDKLEFTPQSDDIEFKFYKTTQIVSWIDRPETTDFKKSVLMTTLCLKLEDMVYYEEDKKDIEELVQALKRRKELLKSVGYLDTSTEELVTGFVGEF
jgi:hypothetical protein